MVNPFSAGTPTLQEAPSFAWRTNGSTFSRKPREQTLANCNALTRADWRLQRFVLRPSCRLSLLHSLPKFEYARTRIGGHAPLPMVSEWRQEIKI